MQPRGRITALSLALGLVSLALLVTAIFSDHWYQTDTRRHREICDGHQQPGGRGAAEAPPEQRQRVMPLYQLRGAPPGRLGFLSPAPAGGVREPEELLEDWRAMLGLGVLEAPHCGRPLFSTHAGLWRKCYRTGVDPDIDSLIGKGKEGRRTDAQSGDRDTGTACAGNNLPREDGTMWTYNPRAQCEYWCPKLRERPTGYVVSSARPPDRVLIKGYLMGGQASACPAMGAP
ncbi:hypothetical protein NDU88_006890 [Pleurodeles waltl]|uniref:Uncharacterized protein n=1 Tax=Pleurodeles waltl TaxID=8319 RepID=A0AAV7RRF0_PLEWA|nr:hypothetical protein NDU88_006890 [Pleurodeles waltl]